MNNRSSGSYTYRVAADSLEYQTVASDLSEALMAARYLYGDRVTDIWDPLGKKIWTKGDEILSKDNVDHPRIPLGKYEHYKNLKVYEVVSTSFDAERYEWRVEYRDEITLYSRKLSSFCETVTDKSVNYHGPRFKKVDDNEEVS